jgi:hypothetical protein
MRLKCGYLGWVVLGGAGWCWLVLVLVGAGWCWCGADSGEIQ